MDNENEITSQFPEIRIEIDWEQYFKDFCELHGKYPVMFDGVLLFPDGWRYSSTDHMGPEYPPPKNPRQLNSLLIVYWERRREIVEVEYRNLRGYIEDIENLQRNRSASLAQTVEYVNGDGEMMRDTQKLDLGMLRKRLEWLHKDALECHSMLEK
jgi:hypothetical protein